MTKYVIKRILFMFLTMFVITVMCFVLIKLLPLPAVREMGRDINVFHLQFDCLSLLQQELH